MIIMIVKCITLDAIFFFFFKVDKRIYDRAKYEMKITAVLSCKYAFANTTCVNLHKFAALAAAVKKTKLQTILRIYKKTTILTIHFQNILCEHQTVLPTYESLL